MFPVTVNFKGKKVNIRLEDKLIYFDKHLMGNYDNFNLELVLDETSPYYGKRLLTLFIRLISDNSYLDGHLVSFVNLVIWEKVKKHER